MNQTVSSVAEDYFSYNAMLNLLSEDGQIQFDKDKIAVRQYFLQHVNKNMVFFHDLQEKLDYLVDNQYYEKELLDKYHYEDIKKLFKSVYAHKFRFASFQGAYKFYKQYALKTNDGQRYLERLEDRVAMAALYLGDGNISDALDYSEEIISGRYQPATPTFLSAGRKQRGEPVSCFPAGTKILTSTGSKDIEDIEVGDKVLTHTGKYQPVEKLNKRLANEKLHAIKAVGHPEFYCTPEHPILIWSSDPNDKRKSIIEGDGANKDLKWIAAKDIKSETDYIVTIGSKDQREQKTYNIFEMFLEQKKLNTDSDFAKEYDIVDGRIKLKLRDKKTIKKFDRIYNDAVLAPFAVVKEDYDFGVWVGYFLSQGYVMKRNREINGVFSENYTGVSFTFNTKHEYFINDVINLTEKIFGIKPTVNINVNDGSTKVNVNSIFIGYFIEYLFGTGFDKKRLKNNLLEAPNDFLAGIVIGIFRGDGCVYSSGVTMTLSNPELVIEIRNACLKLGISPSLRFHDSQTPGNKNGEIRIPGSTIDNENFIYELKRDLHKYNGYNDLGWFGQRLFNGSCGDFKTYKVLVNAVSKENYNDYVYNLHVKDDHTYQVNGVIVHNCFLINVPDDMESIARSIGSALQLSKRGGGVALCLTDVREAGAPIKGIDGAAAGLVPVMKLYEDSFSYADQLG